MLRCDLGEIADVSCGGMRVRTRLKPALREGEAGNVVLKWPEGKVAVPATVIRRRKLGLFRWELGVRFDNMTPEQKVLVNQAARFGGANETINGIGCNRDAA